MHANIDLKLMPAVGRAVAQPRGTSWTGRVSLIVGYLVAGDVIIHRIFGVGLRSHS